VHAIASLIRWAIEAMEAERERRISLQLACDKALVEERQARQRQASAALDAERVRRITVLREVEEQRKVLFVVSPQLRPSLAHYVI
jgi:hypothetical protein